MGIFSKHNEYVQSYKKEGSEYKIDADYDDSIGGGYTYHLYRYNNYVWELVAITRKEKKIIKIMNKLMDYPKYFNKK